MTDKPARPSTRDIAEAAQRPAKLHDDGSAAARDTERRDVAAEVDDTSDVALFPTEEADGFRSRWEAIQTGFVDEPKTAVREADALVAQVVTRLAQVFSDEKGALEQQWGRGDSVSTEDLRVALKRYRVFFHRLLSV
jgi:hypothetical protein